MVKEKYKSASYAPHLIAARYVKRLNIPGKPDAVMFRVYECAARPKGKGKNRDSALAAVGAGATIREYDCTRDHLPSWLVDRIGTSSHVWQWSTVR